jgi:sulfate adenylyltransferase subunit 1 (EFTu-like GTPase family)
MIESNFKLLLEEIAADTGNPVEPVFVPVCALAGDNIVHRSQAMPWYEGPSLLELLEQTPTSLDTRADAFRFPVQRVLRPDQTFRGFAGQIASGTVRPGDRITVLPSGRCAEVARIVTWEGDLAGAHAPLSVTLVLDREVDISRGDLIVASQAPATVAKSLKATLVWMDQRPLEGNRRYLLKHTSQTVPAFVASIEHRTNVGTLTREPAATLRMNDIGTATLTLLRPMAIDLYAENRATGAFILIDPESNATVAAGMVTAVSIRSATGAKASGPVTDEERAARWGHRGGVLELNGPSVLVDRIERLLFVRGVITARFELDDGPSGLDTGMVEALVRSKALSGIVALIVNQTGGEVLIARVQNEQITLDANDTDEAIAGVHELLRRAGILAPRGGSDWEI